MGAETPPSLFAEWALDPTSETDRKIAALLWDLSDRRGFRGALEDIPEHDHEVRAEIVAAWRKILTPVPA